MKSKINIENYEAFLLDWMEGNLSEGDVALLKEFLKNHPEIYVDDDLLSQTISSSDSFFNDKHALKKFLKDDVYIAYHEGDLSELKKQEVEEYVAINDTAKKDFELYQKLKLSPLHIIFNDKQALKKRGVIIPFRRIVYTAVSVAALWLMFILFYSPNQQYKPLEHIALIDYEEIIEKDEELTFFTPNKIVSDKRISIKKAKANAINYNHLTNETTKSKDTIVFQNQFKYDEQDMAKTIDDNFTLNEEAHNNYGTVIIVNSETSSKNIVSNKLTIKQYIVSKIKKNILKTNDNNATKFEIDDFAPLIASVSNDKIVFTKRGHADYINVNTKYFSLNRKISN